MCILAKETRKFEEKISREWKVIYKCRNCGKLFEKKAFLPDNFDIPTNIILAAHKCKTGVYGYGDIQASITNNDESWEDKTETRDYIPMEEN